LLRSNHRIGWRLFWQGAEQSDESQSGQQGLNYLIHWGSLSGWNFDAAEVYDSVC